METKLLSVVGLLLVILIALFLANRSTESYSMSSKGLAAYPYEGFEGIQKAFEARYGEPFVPNSEEKKFAEAFEASQSPPIKVTGFNGLMSGAVGNEQIIGFMYNNESNTTCKPFGYTNSKGNICMSDSDIKLLTTRGMNASGVSDQIGN
jgi:hypothetical protein